MLVLIVGFSTSLKKQRGHEEKKTIAIEGNTCQSRCSLRQTVRSRLQPEADRSTVWVDDRCGTRSVLCFSFVDFFPPRLHSVLAMGTFLSVWYAGAAQNFE